MVVPTDDWHDVERRRRAVMSFLAQLLAALLSGASPLVCTVSVYVLQLSSLLVVLASPPVRWRAACGGLSFTVFTHCTTGRFHRCGWMELAAAAGPAFLGLRASATALMVELWCSHGTSKSLY